MYKVLMIIAIIFGYYTNVLALDIKEINGKVNTYRDSGLTFYALDIKEDNRPVFLFPVSDLGSHPASKCVKSSLDNGSNIVLFGAIENDGEYLKFYDNEFICVNKKNDNNNQNKFSDTTSNLDLVGPKIFNLQLGMNENEAKKYVNDICYKLNLKTDINSVGAYGCGNIIEADNLCRVVSSNGVVTTYVIPFKAFNFISTGEEERREFLRNFITHYNIPELKVDGEKTQWDGVNFDTYYYSSPKEGWKITLESVTLCVQSIPKSSSVIFK